MRKVAKGAPPSSAIRGGNWQRAARRLRAELGSLLAARRIARARRFYEDEVLKPAARQALAREQAALCAFCEKRIDADVISNDASAAIRIAHWEPVRVDPSSAVSWSNLFASCSAVDSCDIRQGDASPGIATAANRDWSRLLEFHVNGGVTCSSGAPDALRRAITEIWNLNSDTLAAARRAAIDEELNQAHRRRDQRRVGKAVIINQRVQYLNTNVAPFQSAVLQALNRWR